MSRTWKRYSGNCYRSPKGKRQALVAGGRKGAIPPDSWDDISFDKQCGLPFRVAKGMAKQMATYEEIVQHVMKKFGIRLGDAEWIAEVGRWNRPRSPEGLLAIACEEEIVP